MALTLGDNFSYQGAKPLDARLKYDTLAAMKAVADATMYEGCMAYCSATDKTYQWKSTNTVDTDTGKWREFSSGGGGGTSDYSDLTNKPSINNVTLTGNKTSSDLGLAPSTVADSCYKTGDSAETTLADADKFPFYDNSASAKRSSTWSNLKAKLKSYFDTLYQGIITAGTGLSKSSNTLGIKAFESGDMDDVIAPLPSSASKYMNYSTEEQVVGQWIEGSTVYQKTFTGTLPSSTTAGTLARIALVDISSLNAHVIQCTGCIKKTSGDVYFTDGFYDTNKYYTLFGAKDGTVSLATSQAFATTDTYYVTIQYIKIT